MKKLDLTPKIIAALKKVDDGLDPATVSVYEATAINTLPVRKKGSLFHGAVLTEATLSEMVTYLNDGGNVPLHKMHDQGYELPVGKVFYGETVVQSGVPGVQIYFYIVNTETDLISKVDSSVIEELSIGFESKHLLCSECGFDYKGELATSEHYWNQTCDEGHTIGVDGVHLNMSGLERWYETSLVSLGAARGAKIVGRAKTLLGETEYNRLAASGIAPDAKILFASPTKPPSETSMDKEFIAQLSTQAIELGGVKAELGAKTALVTELTGHKTRLEGELQTARADLATANTELATLRSGDAVTKLAATEANLTKAMTALSERAAHVAVAAGMTKPAADATVDVLLTAIKDAEVKLSALPVGGIANQATTASGAKVQSFASAANFQTRN